MRKFGYNEPFIAKVRRFFGPITKFFLTVGFATLVHTTTMESGLSNKLKQETTQKVIEEYNKTHVNIPELGLIKVPEGYELYDIKDSTLVTSYTPTGKGLQAGKNKDGSKYEETGLTSTGHDALHDFSGVAAADSLIPAGAIAYIPDEGWNKPEDGWKIVDDTGGTLIKNAKKGITQIDVRTNNYRKAIHWGKQHKKVYIFVKKDFSSKNKHDRVQEARDMYAQGMDKSFQKL